MLLIQYDSSNMFIQFFFFFSKCGIYSGHVFMERHWFLLESDSVVELREHLMLFANTHKKTEIYRLLLSTCFNSVSVTFVKYYRSHKSLCDRWVTVIFFLILHITVLIVWTSMTELRHYVEVLLTVAPVQLTVTGKILWENVWERLSEYCSVTQDISPPTSAAGPHSDKDCTCRRQVVSENRET